MSAILHTPKWQDPRKVYVATIHTTASAFAKALTAAQISAIDRSIWGQVSYHHVIELDGRDTRTLEYDQIGCHVGKHNTWNIGISYVGGLGRDGKPADTRTPAQRRALEARIRALRAVYPNIKIIGHRDWSPDLDGDGRVEPHEWLKACPCFDVASWLKEIGL